MASFEHFLPTLLSLEGGFVNDPSDRGGATNMGVTLACWRRMGYDKDGDGDLDAEDIKLLTRDDVAFILRKFYWNRWQGDEIRDQKLAEMLVDWLWCSGRWGIVIPQRILQVPEDGVVCPRTLKALNSSDSAKLLMSIYNARLAFLRNIVRKDYSQQKFIRGWVNRLNSFL